MAKKKVAKKKTIPIRVVVSIPGAGDFIAVIKLDPTSHDLRHNPPQLGDINDAAFWTARDWIRVKPVTGEAKRVQKLITNLRKKG